MTVRSVLRAILVGVTLLNVIVPSLVRSQDDDSKAIKAEVFLKERPINSSPSKARYRPAVKLTQPPALSPPSGMVLAEIGLTIWRYREATGIDKTKELVEEDEDQEWILERIPEGTLLSPGQKVRLSIESLSRTGYLYVISREEYADGSFGAPKLLFPTQKSVDRIKVEPGRLTYIPSATGRFRIKPSESAKTHVGESLTIIVSKKPLIDARQLKPLAITLQPDQINQWLNQWKTKIAKFEMVGGAGKTMTAAEQTAAKSDSSLMSQGDPVPQTIYQLIVKPDDPLLIVLPLRFVR